MNLRVGGLPNQIFFPHDNFQCLNKVWVTISLAVWFVFLNLGKIQWNRKIKKKERKNIDRQKGNILTFPSNGGVLIHCHEMTEDSVSVEEQRGSRRPAPSSAVSVKNKLNVKPHPVFVAYSLWLALIRDHWAACHRGYYFCYGFVSAVRLTLGLCACPPIPPHHNSMGKPSSFGFLKHYYCA